MRCRIRIFFLVLVTFAQLLRRGLRCDVNGIGVLGFLGLEREGVTIDALQPFCIYEGSR